MDKAHLSHKGIILTLLSNLSVVSFWLFMCVLSDKDKVISIN